MPITITHIDTACILLDINGFRILTDPTLDKAGHLYYHGFGAASRKTDNPALPASGLEEIDLILLSHHQHKDNFDNNGRAFIDNVSTVLSTKNAARDIPGITGLDNWETYPVETDKLQTCALPLRLPSTIRHGYRNLFRVLLLVLSLSLMGRRMVLFTSQAIRSISKALMKWPKDTRSILAFSMWEAFSFAT
jgi:L-ascorbate metabolism protein UlaG (beta-lactamase superfamily)